MSIRERALDLSDEHGLVCLPTRFKFCKGLRKWQEIKDTYNGPLWTQATGFAISAGEVSGVTVIDVDTPARQWFEKFWAHLGLPDTMKVETPSGGCHLYYKYDKRLQTTTRLGGVDIDVRNDRSLIVAPTSPYHAKGAKAKYNGKLYEYAVKDDGTNLDWDYIRPLDEIWFQIQECGIDPDTFEIGSKQTKKVQKDRTFGKFDENDPIYKRNVYENDEAPVGSRQYNNRKCFMELMVAFGKKYNSRDEWRDGIWAICEMARKEEFDELRFADEWSKQIPGYSGLKAVYDVTTSYDPMKKKQGLAYIMFKMKGEDAVVNFNNAYWKKYYYVDYNILMQEDFIALPELYKYFKSALKKYDPAGVPMWYLRYKGKKPGDPDRWVMHSGNGIPFKGDQRMTFNYKVAKTPEEIAKEKRDGKENPDPYRICESSFQAQLTRQQFKYPVYTSMVYRPWYHEAPVIEDYEFNQFRGYRHTAMNDYEWDELVVGDVKKGIEAIKKLWEDVLAGGDEKMADYIFNWLAHLLCKGWQKTGTALCFIGKQGCGKSAMWEKFIMEGIIGKSLCNIVTDIKQFSGKFNSERMNKSLHILNECGSCRGKENAPMYDKLKSMITDETFRCEYKGKEAIQATDSGSYVLISNHEYSVKVEDDDRRFAIPDIKPYKFKNVEAKEEYWDQMMKYIANPLVQRAFFTALVSRDISDFNPRAIPTSIRRQQLKEAKSSNLPLCYLQALVENDDTADWYIGHEGWYSLKFFRNSWTDYCKENNVKYQAPWPTIQNKFKEAGLLFSTTKKTCVDKSRKQAVCLSRDIVREVHRNWLNTPDWDFPKNNVPEIDGVDDASRPHILEI